jgi:hypothetical protein
LSERITVIATMSLANRIGLKFGAGLGRVKYGIHAIWSSADDRQRMHDLAVKNQNGKLSSTEQND